ncbi:MAG TPA: hypothetical protein DCP92_16575, partial [Nitrospiraceae bacterium]|nr:hypothetical protein [Nitrospiraceae bacterium]
KHWAAKVTESQVIEIRRLYKNGERVRRIAEKFNLNEGTTHDICHRKTWKHLEGD